MLNLTGFEVETLLEDVLTKITGKHVSVLTLGEEVSVNLNGELFHFDVTREHDLVK